MGTNRDGIGREGFRHIVAARKDVGAVWSSFCNRRIISRDKEYADGEKTNSKGGVIIYLGSRLE